MLLKEEIEFYERYKWVLQPFLSFKQILEKLNLLLDEDIHLLPKWCKEEWTLNLYLLSCAALDIIDDYFVRGIWDFTKITDYISLFNKQVSFIRDFTAIKSGILGKMKDKKLYKWRSEWGELLITICENLIRGNVLSKHEQYMLKEKLVTLTNNTFPEKLLNMRMRIPAAYRSQDLTHYDFIELAKKYVTRHTDSSRQHIIIGLRTAGSYIAPLVCAYLREMKYKNVNYITIRPKNHIHPFDERQLKDLNASIQHFVIVDEPPGTGKTIARCVDILKKFGIKQNAITILLPVHPAQKDWLDQTLKTSLGEDVEIILLEPEEWYKSKLLSNEGFRKCLSPYFNEMGIDDFKLEETEHTLKINEKINQNPDRAFHVRLKRVTHVISKNNNAGFKNNIIMAKSVGWGWLSYHAALIAKSLSGYIPQVYGLRNGIIYMEWIPSNNSLDSLDKAKIVKTLTQYIIKRANRLRLEENPMFFLSSYRDSGLQSVALVLSKVFGTKMSKLKRGWIRKRLGELKCPSPSFLDSRMMRDEWISNGDGRILKTDFEHHGFSKTASHNIADPAYDISSAMLEFDFTDEEKSYLIQNYIDITGDTYIFNRIIYYSIFYGCEKMNETLKKLNSLQEPSYYKELNLKYIKAWNFLINETIRYAATFIEGQSVKEWKEPLFVMDIDDVLDKNIFGFPSISANGIKSLSLLRMHNVCSIINTARSLSEVKEYCKHYGFAGGIGEYGSVIWDEIEQKTEVLVSEEAYQEILVLREELQEIPGVFINPFYEYSIRAYFYNKEKPQPLPDAIIGYLFEKRGIKHLTVKKSYIDTAIYSKSTDKGKALLSLKLRKNMTKSKIGAVGDTESDLPMLIVADRGFLVNNSSIELKRKARHFGITITSSSFQSGLLEAVNYFLHGKRNNSCDSCKIVLKNLNKKNELFWDLLKIADLPLIKKWPFLFDKHIFELFKK